MPDLESSPPPSPFVLDKDIVVLLRITMRIRSCSRRSIKESGVSNQEYRSNSHLNQTSASSFALSHQSFYLSMDQLDTKPWLPIKSKFQLIECTDSQKIQIATQQLHSPRWNLVS